MSMFHASIIVLSLSFSRKEKWGQNRNRPVAKYTSCTLTNCNPDFSECEQRLKETWHIINVTLIHANHLTYTRSKDMVKHSLT